jgi:hypothetical protein
LAGNTFSVYLVCYCMVLVLGLQDGEDMVRQISCFMMGCTCNCSLQLCHEGRSKQSLELEAQIAIQIVDSIVYENGYKTNQDPVSLQL